MKKLILVSLLLFSSSICFPQISLPNALETLDPITATSCYTESYNGNKGIAQGTGFFIDVKGKLYFITNDHVVGGDFFIDEYKRKYHSLPPSDSIPDTLHVRLLRGNLDSFILLKLPLKKNGKDNYIKFWGDELKKINEIDAVAIPVDYNAMIGNATVFHVSDTMEQLITYPSLELFIVGYPANSLQVFPYAIWKKATIASETNLESMGIYDFWVDAQGYHGMSGSPVIFRGDSYATYPNNHYLGGGVKTILVGIYNGIDNKSLGLGHVFKISPIVKKLSQY